MPLAVTEFALAALSYPVIFVGDDSVPLAVMGLNTGENLFIDADGGFEPGAYIPAYIRRYPFVLANDESQDRLIVCIDRGSDLHGRRRPDRPCSTKRASPPNTPRTASSSATTSKSSASAPTAFVKLLKDNDLFELKKAIFTPLERRRLGRRAADRSPNTSASRKRS